jgi:hypothetical protein
MTSCFYKIHLNVVMSSTPKAPLPLFEDSRYAHSLLTAKEIAFVFKCVCSWQYRALNVTTVWPVLDWISNVPLFWIRRESFNCSSRFRLCDWSMYCFVAMWYQSDKKNVVPFVNNLSLCQYEHNTTILHAYAFFSGTAAQRGHGLIVHEVFVITHNDAPQSVRLLWTSDQLVAETSIWQHTTDKYPCPQWDQNTRSQQASCHRPTP